MDEKVQKALEELKRFVKELSVLAELGEEYGEKLWSEIMKSQGVLKELAYYHDTGEFWCGYRVAGYTLADILVWQVDHFKAYMDRHEQMNRYRQARLFLESLDIMLKMEKDPTVYIEKMRCESGQDAANG